MATIFAPLRWHEARAIAAWRYEGIYAFYNLGTVPLLTMVALRPVLSSVGVEMYGAHDDSGELIGAFTFVRRGSSVEIGLAMRPDLTGQGHGLAFVQAGLAFGRYRFAPASFRLTVATFNRRAIIVYERAGFQAIRTMRQWTRRGMCEFLVMTRDE